MWRSVSGCFRVFLSGFECFVSVPECLLVFLSGSWCILVFISVS